MCGAKKRMTYNMAACVARAVLLCWGLGWVDIWERREGGGRGEGRGEGEGEGRGGGERWRGEERGERGEGRGEGEGEGRGGGERREERGERREGRGERGEGRRIVAQIIEYHKKTV